MVPPAAKVFNYDKALGLCLIYTPFFRTFPLLHAILQECG
jgi:hypothetical protein